MICVQLLIDVPRDRLVVQPVFNRRRWKDGATIQRIGASLDADGQTQPLTAIPLPDGRLSVRDGHQRLEAVDSGKAPVFARRNVWRVEVLTTECGEAPPEREVQRWCRATNCERKNWSELEEAEWYQAEIDYEIEEARAAKGKLTAVAEGQIRADVIRRLAAEKRVTARTVRYRLKILQMPVEVQRMVANGEMKLGAVQRLVAEGLPREEVLDVVARARNLAAADSNGLRKTATERVAVATMPVAPIRIQSVAKVLGKHATTAPRMRTRVEMELKLTELRPVAEREGKRADQARVAVGILEWFLGLRADFPL